MGFTPAVPGSIATLRNFYQYLHVTLYIIYHSLPPIFVASTSTFSSCSFRFKTHEKIAEEEEANKQTESRQGAKKAAGKENTYLKKHSSLETLGEEAFAHLAEPPQKFPMKEQPPSPRQTH